MLSKYTEKGATLMPIVLNPKKVASLFGLVILILFFMNIARMLVVFFTGHDYMYGFLPLFDLDIEQNIPTFFSSILILLCSCLLAVIAFMERNKAKNDYKYWGGLSAIFLFLSIDEFASIHELLMSPLRHITGASGFFFFAWVIPYGLLLLVLFAIYLRFLFRLPSKIRLMSIISGFIYVTGAFGFEFIGGYYYDIHIHGQKDFVYQMITSFEEILEMGGMLLFLYTLMVYIDSYHKSLSIRISSPD